MRKTTDIGAPAAGTAPAAAGRPLVLRPFAFEVVTLDQDGRGIERRHGHAQQFIEDLADDVILEMAQIPGGTFLMGAPESEADSLGVERPQHPVTVPPFFLGRYTVTIEQWLAVMGALPEGMQIVVDEAFTASARQPVVRVSYNDADAFCVRLSRATGRDYRLPTEAEWEYACRAGTTSPFAFGATITREVANYDSGSPGAAAAEEKTRGRTVPVGSLGAANGFGLLDMHGNVYELCEDRWHSSYQGAPADGSAWVSDADQRTRVLRGGSWSHRAKYCRAAARNIVGNPTGRSRKIGFRVAMTPR